MNLAVTTYPRGSDQHALFVFIDYNWTHLASRATSDGNNSSWAAHSTPTGLPAAGWPLGAATVDINGLRQSFCFVRFGTPTGLAQRRLDFLTWTWATHGTP
jgi:hypothetical protein